MKTKCLNCGEFVIHKAKPKAEIEKAIVCNCCNTMYDITINGDLIATGKYREQLSDYYKKFKMGS